MQPRLQRLEEVLGEPLFESLLWGHEYDLSGLDDGLRDRIESGRFKRIVFYGMGCSSVVSDIVKGFFKAERIPIQVDVVNDYDLDWFIDREVLKDEATLTVIVCYSGWSVEPCLFFDAMREMTGNRNLIVLSGGGRIAGLCQEHGTSLIQYKLRHADREYPLYHVQQFFAIFLDLFHRLKLTNSTYQAELESSVAFLKQEFHEGTLQRARDIAERLSGSRIALLSTADWYVSLLKQTTMFFNEIAMVPTHRNLLHEFSHTEVATYSDPTEKQAIVVFRDAEADDYTQQKIRTLEGLFGDKSVPQNRNIEFVTVDLDQADFFKKFFFGHFFSVYVAYYLGKIADVQGRDLISIAAKNPWWSQRSIELFPECVDIPASLEPDGEQSVSEEPAKAG
ncbi:SIS domain-containing protein [Streptomyces sp. NPDC057654]|uniref:SIS domain-containing protein n=1 Tax=Streptomyces sp. NPDC057654 TaxID=3346196 RepID=UPI003691DC7F